MTPGIYYFYEYQADKKIRNVGFLKLTQTFQSCHLQISIRQIPAASQEKLPLSMFFFEKDKPRKKTVAELPTQNQCVSCRVTLSEADFPPSSMVFFCKPQTADISPLLQATGHFL